MELSYDWKTFNHFFGPVKGNDLLPAQVGTDKEPIFILRGENRVVSILVRGEDWSEWVGRAVEPFLEKVKGREVLVLELKQLQQWMESCGEQSHFHDQRELLKSQALLYLQNGKELNSLRRRNRRQVVRSLVKKNFLLQAATQSWWTRFLPLTYGIFIRIEDKESTREIFLVFRRKNLDVFHESDLSSLGPQRNQKRSEVIRYLSEKHSMPVQGIFLQASDWERWSQDFEPWKEIARALWKGQLQLVPKRVGVCFLIYLKILLRL